MGSETTKLTAADLMLNEEYVVRRREFRAQVLEYKRNRTLALGPHLTLSFENRHTIRYQVQEMLRIENVTDAAGIRAELDACNRLIPDGSNWKASCFLDFGEGKARRATPDLRGVERALWVQIAELKRVPGISDDDLDPGDGEQAAAVHFVRFELDALQVAVLRNGGAIKFGVDHPEYRHEVVAPAAVREALLGDLVWPAGGSSVPPPAAN